MTFDAGTRRLANRPLPPDTVAASAKTFGPAYLEADVWTYSSAFFNFTPDSAMRDLLPSYNEQHPLRPLSGEKGVIAA